MSDDVLSLLAQGFIQARGEVIEVYPEGFRFADGTMEPVDLIIAATGYSLQLPFLAPGLYTQHGTPDLS